MAKVTDRTLFFILLLFISSCVSKHVASDNGVVYAYSNKIKLIFLTPILIFILFCFLAKKISASISNKKWSNRIGQMQYLILPSTLISLIIGYVLNADTASTSNTEIVTHSVFSSEIKQSIQNVKEIDISWEGEGRHCTRYMRIKYLNGVDSDSIPIGSSGTPLSVAISDLKKNKNLKEVFWVETSNCNFHN